MKVVEHPADQALREPACPFPPAEGVVALIDFSFFLAVRGLPTVMETETSLWGGGGVGATLSLGLGLKWAFVSKSG